MPLPVPLLDDRTYQQLVDDAIGRIAVHTPEWNNFNSSDPGITLIQLFAFMTETLLYRTNRIPEANRLKFLSLLGLPLRPASPGYGLVQFINERGPVEAIPIDKGRELFAGKVPFRTRTDVNVLPVTAALFYKKERTGLDSATQTQYQDLYGSLLGGGGPSQLQYYQAVPLEVPALGKPLPEVDLTPPEPIRDTIDGALWMALLAPKNVPITNVRRAIQQQTLTIGVYPSVWTEGQVLKSEALEARAVDDSGLVFEIAAPIDPDDLTPRYTRLTVEYGENVLDTPGIVQVTLPKFKELALWNFDPNEEGVSGFPPLIEDPDMAKRLVTWIRISLAKTTGTQRQPRLSWVGVNAARIIQALHVANERLGVGTGTPNQRFKVANTPVIFERPLSLSSIPTEPTFTLDVIDDKGVTQRWKRIDDLYAAPPENDTYKDDLVYMFDPESGQVTFGDGLRGRRPALGHVIRVSYEYGGGLQGKIAIGALNKAPSLPGGMKLSNPVDTWGASAGQSVEDGERSIPSFLRHRSRLVTAEDFREITLQAPGVDLGRVEVLPLFEPSSVDYFAPTEPDPVPGVVTVMVVPQHPLDQPNPPDPDNLYLDAIRAWLEPRRLITTRVFVRGPKFIPVYVSIGIVLMPGQIKAIVQRDVKNAVRTYLSPIIGGTVLKDQAYGGGWQLATDLRVQDIEAAVTRVSGVRYVQELKLGVLPPGKTDILPISPDPITGPYKLHGLMLPWLTNIDVSEGDAVDLDGLFGASADVGDRLAVPVPAQLKKC